MFPGASTRPAAFSRLARRGPRGASGAGPGPRARAGAGRGGRDRVRGRGPGRGERKGGASMTQIFHPSTNTISRVSIFGALFFGVALLFIVYMIFRSPYVRGVNVVVDQPVPFSHEHHVRGLGIDCRYCHTSVEKSSFAGIPPTETCMTCHSQIWTDSPMLPPVRPGRRTNTPIRWNRVHALPYYVFFNHSIHVQKGVGCVSCHGQ